MDDVLHGRLVRALPMHASLCFAAHEFRGLLSGCAAQALGGEPLTNMENSLEAPPLLMRQSLA